jgi:calcineurin-like phosphoesterase family protein
MKVFCSDLHHQHSRIVEFTNRGEETTQENHTEWLVDVWNKNVTPTDVCYNLGDYSFAKKYDDIAKFTERLNGTKIIIKGNHDRREHLDQLVKDNLIAAWYDYKEIKIGDTPVVLFHFPIASWHRQGYGAYHLHGHCFDVETQVLTQSGFKNHCEITPDDLIATMNIKSSKLEYQKYTQKFEYNDPSTMYSYTGSFVDFNVTDGHRIVHTKGSDSTIKIDEIKNLKSLFKIPTCVINDKPDFPIEDDYLRLYLHIATDGSFENLDLIRFHYRKERKIKELCRLLDVLNIKYSKNLQKAGTTKINFKLPSALDQFKIKPLDRELLLNLSMRQVKILVETYEISDGCATGKNSWQFSTSKEGEAHLLQETLVLSGYSCNLLKRVRGKYVGYVLSVNTRNLLLINANKFKKTLNKQFTWCLSVPNGTLIVRRNGKVHVTGNCHGNFKDYRGKMLDVGIDSVYNLYGKHGFLNEQQIVEFMKEQKLYIADHHKEYK